jgi:hypothetical protein
MVNLAKRSLPFLLATVSTLASLRFASVPYLWIALSWTACFVWLAVTMKRIAAKRACVSLATGVFMVGALEAFAYIGASASSSIPPEVHYSTSVMVEDDLLGYGPVKDTVVRAQLKQGTRTVYDVAYTLGVNGLRVSRRQPIPGESCLLFFGDSFTFGVGVDDHETSPSVVADRSGYPVYNFGFVGYGPHQMLRAIESGLVERTVRCRPVAVVYQALMEHGARASGWSEWDRSGPKYMLSGGTPRYAGHFDDYIEAKLQMQIKKSFLYTRYVSTSLPIRVRQSRLLLELVHAARQHLRRLYPSASFHMVLWNFGPEDRSQRILIEGLRGRGIEVTLATSILPNFPGPAFELGGGDHHPSPLAHRLIAEHIAENVLRRRRNSPD